MFGLPLFLIKRHLIYVEVMLNEIGHESNTYSKSIKSCDEIIDRKTTRLGFEITEKDKHYRSRGRFLITFYHCI